MADRSPARRCDGTKFCAALEHAPDCRSHGYAEVEINAAFLAGRESWKAIAEGRAEIIEQRTLRAEAAEARAAAAEAERDERLSREQSNILAEDLQEARDATENLHWQLSQAEAELETLRAALRAIADPQSWKHGDPSPAERARAALAGSTDG